MQAFIWDNSTSKIAQNTLIQKIEKGGLKLYHFPMKVHAFKLSWIKRLISNNDTTWKILPKTFFKYDNLNVYFGAKHRLLHNENIPKFYTDIHNLYMKDKKTPTNSIQILNQSLWLNENVKINNTYLYSKHFIDKGILYIKDILDNNVNFLNQLELTSKYKLITNFIECLQLQSCISREWKDRISKVKLSASKIPDGNCIEINNKYINIDNIQCKDFYWHLIEKYQHNPKCKKAWIKEFPDIESVNNNFGKEFQSPILHNKRCKHSIISI